MEKQLTERYEFRLIQPEEIEQAIRIEQICFPPHEACSAKSMKERTASAADYFLVAVDKCSGKIAGFLNGIATDEGSFRDEFFTDATLHNSAGKTVMLLGLDVLPEHRGQGLAREIMARYSRMAQDRGKCLLMLTCLDVKVEMYAKMGFTDNGIADSSWGGEEWHEMQLVPNSHF